MEKGTWHIKAAQCTIQNQSKILLLSTFGEMCFGLQGSMTVRAKLIYKFELETKLEIPP